MRLNEIALAPLEIEITTDEILADLNYHGPGPGEPGRGEGGR